MGVHYNDIADLSADMQVAWAYMIETMQSAIGVQNQHELTRIVRQS